MKEKITRLTEATFNEYKNSLESTKRQKDKQVIDYEDYLKVEHWYLYKAIDKNVANIVNKAKTHQKFMEKLLFTQNKVPFSVHDERIRYFYVNF